jgi:hypothetical protein
MVLVLFVLVVGPVVGYFAVVRFLEGERTTKLLKSLIEDWVGSGEVTLLPLEWSGLAAYCEGMEVRDARGVSRVKVDQFRGGVSLRGLFVDRVWKLEGIEAQRVQVEFAGDVKEKVRAEAERKRTEGLRDIPWWAWWLPRGVAWGPVKLSRVDVRWPWLGSGEGGVEGMAVELNEESGGWNIRGSGGEIVLPQFPRLGVVKLDGRVREPYFFITSLRWQSVYGAGEGEVSGELALDRKLGSRLRITGQSIPLENFLKGDWRARLQGSLEGSMDLNTERVRGADGDGAWHWKGIGKLKVVDGVVEALPQLEAWARFTGLNEYRYLRLHRAEANVLVDENGVTLRDVKLESQNLVRAEGRLRVKDGRLEGEFEVGLTDGQVRLIPGGREGIFRREADGYLWAVPPVRVYGTVDDVKEDLSGRVGSALIDKVQRKIESGAEKILERVRSWF